MSKLEEKLIELGYKEFVEEWYIKRIDNAEIHIYIGMKKIASDIDYKKLISTQQDLDNLQQAFDIMQKDLEELKKYEEV